MDRSCVAYAVSVCALGYMREVRAAAGVIGWTIIILAALIGGCLLIVGCTTTPVVTECEHGLSWRGDCNQPLFKE